MEGSLGDANASLRGREFAVPTDALKAFRAHRVKIRKPMTDHAEKLLATALRKIHEEHGHDPTAVLEQSMLNGWAGVFPLKEEQNGGGNRSGAGPRDNRDGFKRALDRRLGEG